MFEDEFLTFSRCQMATWRSECKRRTVLGKPSVLFEALGREERFNLLLDLVELGSDFKILCCRLLFHSDYLRFLTLQCLVVIIST